MNHKANLQLHGVMAVLLLGSLILDQMQERFWQTGSTSMVTLCVAMVWLGRYALEGFQQRDAMMKVINNRLSAMEERCDDLERVERSRQGPV